MQNVKEMMSSLRGTLSLLQRGGEDASLLEAESAVTVQALCRHVASLQKGFIALRRARNFFPLSVWRGL